MKRFTTFLLCLTISLLFFGCATKPVATEPLEKLHPDWSKEIIAGIERGDIMIGMTKEQVREALRHKKDVLNLKTEGDVWYYGEKQITSLVGYVSEITHDLTFSEETGLLIDDRLYVKLYPHEGW